MEQSGQLMDFYFSEKALAHLTQIKANSLGTFTTDSCPRDVCPYRKYFKGKLYTEVVPHGLKPIGIFNDMILLGSGTMNDVTSEPWILPTCDLPDGPGTIRSTRKPRVSPISMLQPFFD